MRKKSGRVPRLVAKPLTPAQLQRMVVGPRMHLHLLLSGCYEHEYAGSIGGLFNVATALAHFKGHVELQAVFDGAQDVLLQLMEDMRAPDDAESERLREAFNLADQWIGIQDTAILTRAINYANKEIAAQRQAAANAAAELQNERKP